MSKEKMPTAEAAPVDLVDNEPAHYELAFHILPTVVEGEVPTVFAAVKSQIEKAGGEITDEEAPQRIELAYEIIRYIEGRNRSFTSAYFGWVRFKVTPSAVADIAKGVESQPEILRHLVIRLTKAEEAEPFRYHEALEAQKQVTEVVEEDVVQSSPVADEDTEADSVDAEDKAEASSDEEKAQ